jgi:hypothetical protein
VNGNFILDISVIEVSISIGSVFSKHKITIDTNLLPASSLIILWKNPQLIVLINCKFAGSIIYTNEIERNILSLPSIKESILLSAGNSMLFPKIQSALTNVKCVDDVNVTEYDEPKMLNKFSKIIKMSNLKNKIGTNEYPFGKKTTNETLFT